MKEIIERIKAEKSVLLFLDYDGTLVPIKRSPELAVLHPVRRRMLQSLSEKIFLCIVSGRSLPEIKKLVGIDNIAYIGNHGMEIYLAGKQWIHPGVRALRPILKDVLQRVRLKTKDFQGVIIEDKGMTGSIHYRLLTPDMWNTLKRVVHEEIGLSNPILRIAEGKKVFEIRPRMDWDKGKGVMELIRRLNLKETPLQIYIGDDKTDEDAFRVFDKDSVTILVGHRKDSYALFRLDDVDQVWKFLRALFKIWIH
jgi:trehalose-phosphatase